MRRTLPDGSLTMGFAPLWLLDGYSADEAASGLPVTSRRIGAAHSLELATPDFEAGIQKGLR